MIYITYRRACILAPSMVSVKLSMRDFRELIPRTLVMLSLAISKLR